MSFDIYDIFSKVIPGGILLAILMLCNWVPVEAYQLPQLLMLLVAYSIGHILDGIASRKDFEKVFGKEESIKQLDKSLKYGEYHKDLDAIITKMDKSWDQKRLSLNFTRINREVKFDAPKRVQGFQSHWVSARNLFLSAIVGIFPISQYIVNSQATEIKKILYTALVLACLWVLYDKATKRRRFYVKEVLDFYLYKEKK
jgi:hypothetical protein